MSADCLAPEFSTVKHRALRALLAGEPAESVAQSCGISPRTLRAWRQQPAFQAALVQGQTDMLHAVSLQLASAATVAVQTLVDICHDPDARDSARVAAAGKLLNFLSRSTPGVAGVIQSTATDQAAPAPPQITVEFDKPAALLTPETFAAPVIPPPPVLSEAVSIPLPATEPSALPSAASPACSPVVDANADLQPLPLDFQLPAQPAAPRPRPSQPFRALPSDTLLAPTPGGRSLTLTVPSDRSRCHAR